jgi:hypothetical protein
MIGGIRCRKQIEFCDVAYDQDQEDAYKAAAESKELMIVPSANHIDLYDCADKIPFDKYRILFRQAPRLEGGWLTEGTSGGVAVSTPPQLRERLDAHWNNLPDERWGSSSEMSARPRRRSAFRLSHLNAARPQPTPFQPRGVALSNVRPRAPFLFLPNGRFAHSLAPRKLALAYTLSGPNGSHLVPSQRGAT